MAHKTCNWIASHSTLSRGGSSDSNLIISMFTFMMPSESTVWRTHFVTNAVRKVLLGIKLVFSVVAEEACPRETYTATYITRDGFLYATLGRRFDVFHISTSSFQLSMSDSVVLKIINTNSNQILPRLLVWLLTFPGITIYSDLFKCVLKVVVELFARLALRA